MPKLSRRTFLRSLASGTIAAGGVGLYARWGEPHWLQVDRQPISLPQRLGNGRTVRMLHLSDFHYSPVVSLDYIAESIALGIAQRPDIIFLTGDFFTDKMPDHSRYVSILQRLPVVAPTFACLGNHDGGYWSKKLNGYETTKEVLTLLDKAKITCLQNESRELFVNRRKLQIIGLGDFWSQECKPAQAFVGTPLREGATRILLNHNPDAKFMLSSFDWDLMLCGHTHGGQVKLPFIGTPFAPVSDKKYVSGLHPWENRLMYITKGVGNLHGLRFNCRPQVSVLDLV